MKGIKKYIALILCAVMLAGTVSGIVPTPAQAAEPSQWKYGLNGAMGWNEDTYYTVSKRTNNDNWRQGLASANGEIAFIESGDPDEDVFIFNNTKIVYDDNGVHEVPYLADIIDEQREGAINFNNWVWNQAANQYDEQTYGINGGRGMVWSRPYQPAAQYRIKNHDFSDANRTNYNRYANYETAEVGAQWKDAQGNEWNRRSFASREDDVIVTYIEAPEGKTLNLTVSMDHITDMRNEGTLDSHPATDYVVTREGGSVVGFGTVGKYVTRNQMGSRNNNKTLFSYGGWASATRIVMGSGGSIAYTAATRTVEANSSFAVSQAYQANDPQLKITGTNSVMLITKVDRQDDGCNNVNDVRQKLYDRLQGEIADLVEEKGIESTEAGYQTLLAPHKELHGGMFNNVRIDLCQTEAEKADRLLTNQQLIAKQNANKNEINKAFLERVYNNGRYGLICAHGYGSTRLSAIWCGTWNPSWSGDYTLDANTNLQVSGLNTGNMMEAGQGYINFIVRMVADWEINAEQIYSMEDAILGPPRVDGTGQGQSYHYSDVYPHVFVNGITDWLLIPIFEYWQCYGNQQIELGKDIDLERNMSVLDWTEEDVARIRENGFYDLEEDVLYPLSIKAMNFWLQFADENYYTDGSSNRHVNDGTTLSDAIAKGDEDAKYIFAPGYSPENSPEKGGATVQALAYNVTMDISAARDSLFIARTMLEKFDPESELFVQWDEFEKRIPDYLYEPKSGELKEWASYDLKEAHNHRHESHAYGAWPGYEAQDNEALREGIAIAMDMRSAAYNGQEATGSHGATHKALVEARLKRPVALERVMLYLLTNGYQYSNMLTSHNRNQTSCLCTDSAFGLMGAVNESLLYSNTGIIEILPTLLPNLDKGSITGLRARSNTQADICWDRAALTASTVLTTDEDTTELTVMCGLDWEKATVDGKKQTVCKDELGRPYITVALTKGTPVEVSFTLTPEEATETREAYGEIPANSYDKAKRDFGNAEDGSIGETRSLDYIAFRGMDFGIEGSRPRMVLTASSTRTEGGLNADGTSVVRIYTDDPADGYPAIAEITIPNTNGIYQDFEVELPERLSGVQDIYIKFQDGGCNLKSLEFFAMPIANVEDGKDRSISRQNPLVLELNTDSFSYTLNGSAVQNGKTITEPGEWTLVVKRKDSGEIHETIHFTTYISDANRLFTKTVSLKPGETLTLEENLNDPDMKLWLAPPRASVFTESSFMTCVSGDKAQITVPGAEGTYALAVVDQDGKLLSRSDALVKVSAFGLADIDFTDPGSAGSFEIINPNASSIRDGQGLYMITTKDGFEPANDQLSGDAASNPKDLVLIPVQGDWEATLEFDFSTAGASNGYYQFFGFYAMQDYQNAAGIRGGDGAMQDFLRKNGTVTAETMNSQPGLASNGTYWYRITKVGTTYTCSRSENGRTFDEMFSFPNTGIEAKNIAIDAYTGMTEGYTFMLKSLVFTGQEIAPHEHSYETVVTQPTCLDKGYTTHICILCGESYVDGETAALGHKYEGGACTVCGKADPNPGCPSEIFSDVPDEDHWAHAGIDYCVSNKLMNGTGEGKFNPGGTLTRAELVTILYRVEGSPKAEYQGTFEDVKEGQWYTDAVEWAATNKIVNGVGDGTNFAPTDTITREQIATILYRYAGSPEVKGDLKAFPDEGKVSSYAATAMAWAVEEGIITGATVNNVTYINPLSSATREQIASIMMRYLEAK